MDPRLVVLGAMIFWMWRIRFRRSLQGLVDRSHIGWSGPSAPLRADRGERV